MNKIASLMLFGILLFSFSAISRAAKDDCAEAIRVASKVGQDYRQAVGKVRTACDTSAQQCSQSLASVEQTLSLLTEANRAVYDACVFVLPPVDDSLPVSAATVAAAMDAFPVSALPTAGRSTFRARA